MSEIGNRSQTGATVVFIQGLWMTPRSWEHWAARFERGHTVLAPSWPGMEGEVEELNLERYAVPAAKRVLSAVAFANLKRNSPMTVDFAKADRAPLLFVAFDQDHIVPAKASRHNAEKYTKTGSPSVVEFKEFAGRPHFPGASGWEEIADYAIDWAEKQGATQPAP